LASSRSQFRAGIFCYLGLEAKGAEDAILRIKGKRPQSAFKYCISFRQIQTVPALPRAEIDSQKSSLHEQYMVLWTHDIQRHKEYLTCKINYMEMININLYLYPWETSEELVRYRKISAHRW
jgi:hypothetical protein